MEYLFITNSKGRFNIIKVLLLLQTESCGLFIFTSHAHFNEVESLTFLLELRNIASSSLYWLWEKGEGLAPLPGYWRTPPSPPSSEDRFISVSWIWAWSRHSPSEPLDVRGWRFFHKYSKHHWNQVSLKTSLARATAYSRTVAAFLQLGEKGNILCSSHWGFFWTNICNLFSSSISGIILAQVGKSK